MVERPVISVIAVTRNRSGELRDLIASLGRSTSVSFPWEVIVVDNASTDDTPDVCRRATDSFDGGTFRYVVERVPGLHAGRHRGAREAGADVLVFVDDDIEVSPGWLTALREAFRDPEVELVGGPCLPRYEVEPPPWVESTWKLQPDGTKWCGHLSLIESGDSFHEIDPGFVWGLNLGIRRETLYRLRGFHPDALPWTLRRYRGDGESGLSLKAKATGVRAWYCPHALVYHGVSAGNLTVDYFMRRGFLQGISDSFTEVRAQGGPLAPAPSVARHLLARARQAGDPRRWSEWRSPNRGLRSRLRAAHDAGYSFHQREIAADPALLAWVLREDYMEDAVPGTGGGRNV